MINKKLEEIEESDIKHLIDEQIIERKTLEYKSEIPGNGSEDKKKFLASVSSFANAIGGDLIYGIIEDRNTGAPQSPLEGISISNVDQEILRLEQLIRDGIEPNIPSYNLEIREISLSNNNYVLIIRVKKSWLAPHRISFKTAHRFYSRSTNGKYLMDIQELRSAFIFSEVISTKVKNFREERISSIISGRTPIPLYNEGKIILHLIPIEAFSMRKIYEIERIARVRTNFRPMFISSGWNERYNLDGYLAHYARENRESSAYVQLYRNGIIEAVEDYVLVVTDQKIIPITDIEGRLISFTKEYLEVQKFLDIEGPILFSLTFLGVKGYFYPPLSGRGNIFPIERDLLLFPEILFEKTDIEPVEIGKKLKHCYDAIWNSVGYSKSPNYNQQGEWVRRRM